ncbi:MAG: diguanylate cyclase [Oscillospiraceae bacterium]|nr:diguanylate cyclase [Oscillospiraceae bacterium]
MKQFQTVYRDRESFRKSVAEWNAWREENASGQALVHIFSDGADDADVNCAREIVGQLLPDASCIGASASGNIYGGNITTEKLVVTCTVFEHSDSFVRTRFFSIENRDVSTLRASLRAMKADYAGVKAIEVIMTIDTIPIREVCAILQEEIPEDIQIWGGGAFGDNVFTAYIFDKGQAVNIHGIVLAMMGGRDLHVMSSYVIGWRPLGSALKVTRAEGKVLYELDGNPAYQIYQHYLRIPNDEHIFYNALEFPFAVSHQNRILLRHALACHDDGSIDMSTDIPEGSIVHLTYGDPDTIMQNVSICADQVRDFGPEVISIFDCFGRKSFWGSTEGSRETRPLHKLAPTYGFCTAGELIRWQGGMDHHNLSLVVAAMREGGPAEQKISEIREEPRQNESSMSMVSRLVNFINTATAEVIEANSRLSIMAITDQLTQLFNRGEIQRQITERIQDNCSAPAGENATSLVMIDLDDFKQINDTYGHNEGDQVLIAVSAQIRTALEELGNGAIGGRWGGEEFMVMLPGMTLEAAADFAESLRMRIESLRFDLCGRETASFGVAQALPGEESDPLVLRADVALYVAKKSGKNRVCRADGKGDPTTKKTVYESDAR